MQAFPLSSSLPPLALQVTNSTYNEEDKSDTLKSEGIKNSDY